MFMAFNKPFLPADVVIRTSHAMFLNPNKKETLRWLYTLMMFDPRYEGFEIHLKWVYKHIIVQSCGAFLMKMTVPYFLGTLKSRERSQYLCHMNCTKRKVTSPARNLCYRDWRSSTYMISIFWALYEYQANPALWDQWTWLLWIPAKRSPSIKTGRQKQQA